MTSQFESIQISMDEMQTRIARFQGLTPIANQRDPSVPQSARDIIYARKLLPVIGREEGDTAIASDAPISGAGGITMTLAVCPPNQGPGLHAHKKTFETFTVLKGRFEFRWGDEGENAVELDAFDVLSVPPGVARAFKNVSDEEGVLQVVISGGVHDMNDIHMPQVETEKLYKAAPEFAERLKASGITFSKA